MNRRSSIGHKRSVTAKALLIEMVDNIKKYFDPLKIVLFGFRVRDSANQDSDYDWLVVVNSDKRPAQRASRIRKQCRPKFLPVDVLVRTPEEIKERLEIGDFFIEQILERGLVLYEQ